MATPGNSRCPKPPFSVDHKQLPDCPQHPDISLFLKRHTGAPPTQQRYRAHLRWFLEYAAERLGEEPEGIQWDRFYEVSRGGHTVSWAPIDHVFISEFLAHRRELGCSAESHNRILATLRLFFRFLVRQRRLIQDPTYHVEPARVVSRVNHDKYLTLAECEALLRVALESKFRYRDFPLVFTLLSTGARPGETVNLRPADMNFDRGYIYLRGKTGRRTVALLSCLREGLAAYLKSDWYRVVRDGGVDRLFPADNLRSPMTPEALNALIQDLGRKAGVSKPLTTYWTRHSFATHVYRKGLGFAYVSLALGHEKLATTRAYVHDHAERLRQLVNGAPTTMLLEQFHRRQFALK